MVFVLSSSVEKVDLRFLGSGERSPDIWRFLLGLGVRDRLISQACNRPSHERLLETKIVFNGILKDVMLRACK